MLYDPSCPCAICTLARQEMAEAEAPNSTTGGQDFAPCGTNAYRDMKPGETCRDNYGRVFMRTDYDKTGRDFRELTQYEHEALESAGRPAWPDKAGFDSQDFTPCDPHAYRDMKPGETCRDNYGRVFMRTDYDKTGHDFRELTQHEHEAMESAGKSAWPDKAGFDSQDFSPPSKPPIVSGFLAYFPDAVMEVAKVSAAGNRQHGTSGWNKAVSPDELNALGRHLVAHTQGTLRDSDGTLHLAKVAWRAMAALQRLLEA